MSHVMKTLNEKWLQSHIFPPSLQLLLTDYMTQKPGFVTLPNMVAWSSGARALLKLEMF